MPRRPRRPPSATSDRSIPTGCSSPVGKAANEVQERVTQLNAGVSSANAATRLLPDMLGGAGPRNYLLMVQNNAEIRATGGLPGSLSLLHADDGKVRLGFRGSANDFPILTRPVLPLSADERGLYGSALGEDVRQTNQTPDFPRTGQLLSAIVARSRGQQLDGVVSVDPIALSQVLRATGPIRVGKETLNADNVVAKLLNESYQRLPTQDQQNAYFASASRDIANALLGGHVDEEALARKLGEGVRQRRVLVWSRNAAEQKVLESAGISGRLPREAAGKPHVGMYFNNDKGSKMEYYLDYRGSVKSLGCTANGAQDLHTSMTFASHAPPGGRGLSESVTGTTFPSTKGDIKLSTQIYAPTGGTLTGLSVNGKRAPVYLRADGGRKVYRAADGAQTGRSGHGGRVVPQRTRAGRSPRPGLDAGNDVGAQRRNGGVCLRLSAASGLGSVPTWTSHPHPGPRSCSRWSPASSPTRSSPLRPTTTAR